MNLHEYQAKQLFAEYDIPVSDGRVVTDADQAAEAARELGGNLWVVKAQVHAGGRGKGGGVKLAKSPEEVAEEAGRMLGTRLVTPQTDDEGLPIHQVYIEKGSDIESELYLSVLVDRASERVVFMASPEGGVDIEEVAEKTPEKIFQITVHPAAGLQPFQARQLAFGLGLNKSQLGAFTRIAQGLYRMFDETDTSLIEINPLIITDGGELKALDAKVNLDDNALYRHKRLADMRDTSQEDEVEVRASEYDLNYVSLDGNIGCMVNGAGLAMATMDVIKLSGGRPANFLDVGGGATAERVTEAFKIILTNEGVEAILVNIFGGIVRCDLIAEGIIQAVQQVGVQVPVVVRLEGTNVEQGKELLANSGLDIIPADDLTDGAQKAVEAVG